MSLGILQTTGQQRGMILDPRTKLLLLITVSTFVLGGLGGEKFSSVIPALCLITLILLLTAGRIKAAVIYLAAYLAAWLAALLLLPQLSGPLYFLVLGSVGIFSRVMPGVAMGVYVVSTTTVSEFTAAMQRMHISEKIIIPFSVMFRFFPTVGEEFSAINAAMRMRGISFGGGRIGKMLEYRLVPLLTCSARIGEELSAAALTRGLGGNVKRTNICCIGFKMQDVIFIALCFTAFAAVALVYLGVL
ncbi:energy-coupling factor transport system permease protein [Ruminiclostridium sufflavum DSM 19573]|uniref:Energy-coupling factor transport system permease protein n=1 Tax=Ruminiclostridium sufflavum DSM 19573 TaxID=1121337 RepID=A0A318XN11_9FIRM|nr:energy-coupling factor transporter transmembrane component T [Ruminiclostridium sufflavum]PYG89397.1 energy-coupling factor transport system permease protein [Ruminiclostridium sufflavum DSM 19573]